jgi:SulP family sulfate permease
MNGGIKLFKPKLFTCLRDYSLSQFLKDVVSGIIVGIIALPLSIALGIASGVTPQVGLITAIIGGFFVSLLGGSRVQIGGPTGAFIIIVLGIINQYGITGLTVATLMAGIILIVMGLAKFGNLIKFIPYPITTGFTNGIAVVIFSTQIKDFFGFNLSHVPSEFIEKWSTYFSNIDKINPTAMLLGIATVLIIVLLPKVNDKIPAPLVAIVAVTVAAQLLKLDVTTIGSQFGEIKGELPRISFVPVNMEMIQTLMVPAFAIALLGSIESLLSAVVADGMIGGNHRSNTELIGQGVANIFSSLFGGIPVTGAIARTAANVKNGGRTPVAGIVHTVFLFITMMTLMEYFKFVPMASLAGILVVVSYNMGDWSEFGVLNKCPKSDALVFLSTFLLTVVFDLVIAIEIGIVLSVFLFMRRMAEISNTNLVEHHMIESDELRNHLEANKNEVMYYEISGPFFFGAADKFIQAIKSITKMPKVLIIDLKEVPVIDATGYYALERFADVCEHNKTKAVFINMNDKLYKTLDKYGFIDKIGKDNFCVDMAEATSESEKHLKLVS